MSNYRRLSGRGVKRGGKAGFVAPVLCRLYMGSDHLLQVESTRLTESYRRFYFSEIQGFVVRKTSSATWITIVLSVLALGCVSMAVAIKDRELIVMPIIPLAVILLFLIINWIAGPSCVTHVFTSLGSEELGSLKRIRRARKVLREVRKAIESVQGTADPQAFVTPEGYVRLPETASAHRHLSTPEPLQTKPLHGPAIHRTLFLLLLLSGIFTGLEILTTHMGITSFWGLVSAAAFVFGIMSVVRSASSPHLGPLKRLTWTGLAYLAVLLVGAYILSFATAFASGGGEPGTIDLLRVVSEYEIMEFPPLVVLIGGFAAGGCLLGILGLLRVGKLNAATDE
jgi:hypothetical protein